MAERCGADQHTEDGTVDIKGNPVLRSKTGGWRACSFIVAYEVIERMSFYGVSSNLFIYLTKKLHRDTVKSANDVTNWVGTIWMTPIIGAYIADAHLGRYWTFVIASLISISGMSLLTLSASLRALRPPSCLDTNKLDRCHSATTVQLLVFFGSLYTLALGTGGTKPNISTMGADQFDDFDHEEKASKLSFFNWWMFSIFFGTLFANTVLVYIQDNISWALGYGLPTMGLAMSVSIFLIGTPFYRHKLPMGSPFSKMARVLVGAIRKHNLRIPDDPRELHEANLEEYKRKGRYRISHTPSLLFLSKASIKTSSCDAWMLCTVTEVEEIKQMMRMVPILVTTFIPSMMIAQINTLFVKQGTTLDRHIGRFQVPPASLAGFVTISMLSFLLIYDCCFVGFMRRWTKNPRGISLLQRMGIGLFLHIVIMIIAFIIERHRLQVAKKHELVENGRQLPLTIFILLPQFVLMGMADAFLEVAKIEFFYDQAPESMKSLGTSYSTTTLGIGNYLSSILLSTVRDLTMKDGKHGWVQDNLNAAHLDYYYALFAMLNITNFILFVLVIKFYVYRDEVSDSIEALAEKLKDNGKNP